MKKLIIGLLVIFAAFSYKVADGQSIRLRLPDTTLLVGSSVWLPVYVDSSLTGRQVYSFQVQLLHNASYLQADSIRTQGTISANALPTANFAMNGVVNVAGASAMPLNGTGVLFYIRYRVVTNYGGYTTPINFSNASSTYFNQGSPLILFDGNSVTVPSLPSISVSPGSGNMVLGDTLNFTASGGTAPYQWRLSDTTAGSLLPLSNNGIRYVPVTNRPTRVIAIDSNGFTGQTSQPIQTFNFRMQLRDTARFQGSEILFPVLVSDLSAFQVVSGSFTVHLGTAGYLELLGLETNNTLLQSASLVQYAPAATQAFNISFASSQPLQGSGVLVYLRLKFLIPFVSDFYSNVQLSNALFNQGLTALTSGASVRGIGLPQLAISPNTGILVAGETRQLAVSNGFAPFTWSITDSNLATINNQGLLSARQGGVVQVQVSDSLGASRTSGNFTLYDTRIYFRDTVAIVGDSLLTVAVYMDPLPNGKSVNAVSLNFNFDANRLDSLQLIQTNTLSQGWSAAINRTAANAYSLALAGAQGQSQAGVLFYLRFKILPAFLVNQTTQLSQIQLVLNEGNPNALVETGILRLLPCNPSATVSPSGVQTYCASQPGTLSGPSGTAFQYQWYRNGQPLAGANQRQLTPNQSGAYTLRVSLNSTCFVVSDTVTVTINPSPVANVLPYADTLRACVGDTILLATAGGIGYSYQWFRNGSTLNGATDSTFRATLSGNYSVRTSLNGCQTTSAVQPVYFRPLPVKPQIQWNGLAVCAGDSSRLSVPTTNHQISWFNATGQQLGSNDTAIWVGPGRYVVKLTDHFGCSILSDTLTVVAATANAQIDPSGPTSFCAGGFVNLDLTQQASYIRWYRNGQLLPDTLQPIRVDSSGDYWAVYRLSGNSCLFTSPVMTIQVNPRPIASFDTLLPLCVNDSALVLQHGQATGGSYYGPGVQQGVFYPAMAGVGVHELMYVLTQNGCSDTAKRQITVYALPGTSLATFSAVCADEAAFALTTGLPLGGTYFGPGVSQGIFNPSVSGIGNHLIGYTTQNANGCRDTAYQQIQVFALPQAQLLQGDTLYYCPGSPVQLQAVTAPGLTYAWLKDGQLLSGQQSPNLLSSGPGIYRLLVTNANNCTDTSNNITVIELPAVQAQITAMGSTNFCAGTQLVLKANTAPGYSYQWLKDGLLLAAQNADSLVVTQAGAYRVVITNLQGCVDSAAAVMVQVNAIPVATTTPTGQASFCQGESLLIHANTATGVTYSWFRNGILLAGANAATYSATMPGSYRVRVENSSGCFDTSAALLVTENPRPTASISPAGPTSFCQGGSVTLNANTGTGFSYVWLRNGVVIPAANTASIQATLGGDYRVIVSGTGNCTDSSSLTTVTVFSLPAAQITPAGPTSFCAGDSVVLNANTGTGLIYQWLRNDTILAGQTTSSLVVNVSGDYKVRVRNANSCELTSAAQTVVVTPLPATPVLTLRTDTIISSVSNGLLWFRNGVLLAGQNDSFLVVTQSGYYNAISRIGNCQSDSSNAIVLDNVSVQALNKLQFRLYPNPSSGQFFVEMAADGLKPTVVRIYTLQGKLLQENILTSTASENRQELQLHAAAGMYLIELQQGEKRGYQRLLLKN